MKVKGTLKHFLSLILHTGTFDVAVLLLLCVPVALWFNLSVLDPSYWLNNFTSRHNQLTTKTLYEIYNDNHDENDELCDWVTLVDVKDITSRSKIAALIDSVYSKGPMCIAVDFIFPSAQDTDADQVLVETVKRVRDKTIFAYMLTDYTPQTQSFANSKHSFFLDPNNQDWFCDSVMEGYANMKNDKTSEPVWEYSVVEKLGDKVVCSIPAMLIGSELFRDSLPHQSYIINYKKLKVNILAPDDLSSELIKDHMVIIGSYEFSGDKFDSPVGLVPGMLVHAYILQSINGDSIVEQSQKGYNYMTGIALLVLIIVLILTDVLVEFVKEKCNWKFGAMLLEGIFPSVVVGIIAVVLLKVYCYHLLINCNVFSHGQSAFNGILVATAIIKVIYTACIMSCRRNNILGFLTKYSIYSKFESAM